MIIAAFFLSSQRSSLVLPSIVNAPQSKEWCGLAAGHPAERLVGMAKDDKRRNGKDAELQVLDPLDGSRSMPGGTQRMAEHPLSGSAEVERVLQSWLLVEKWEGVRGRVET